MQESILVNLQRSYPKLADENSCTACMACISACNHNALSKRLGEDGHFYVELNNEKCINCKACEHVCPAVNESESYENNLCETLPYKGWNKEEEYRTNGTSGGVFPAIAQSIIKQGGVVVGAYMEHNDCYHRIVECIEELPLLQGSKYIYSDMEGIHKKIASYLREGRLVLFSGLPCQVAGVNSFFKENKNKHLLYTVDLVCGGIPSMLLKNSFLSQNPDVDILSFRTKHIYELKCVQYGNIKNYGKRNLLIYGYLSGLTNRNSCYNCKYSRAHRGANITLGDYWQKNSVNNKGVSLILCHNERGRELLFSSVVQIESVEWINFLYYNSRIVVGTTPWKNRWEHRSLAFIMKKCPKYFQNVLYASDIKKYDVFGIMYLVYKKIRFIFEYKRRLAQIDEILKKNSEIHS